MNDAPKPDLSKAAGLMVASAMCFALMTIAVRLVSQSLPVLETAFWRNLAGFLVAIPFVLRVHRQVPRTSQLGKYFIRCAVGILSMYCIFWSIAHLPLAQAVSISYSSALFITIAAALFLGEVVRIRRWMAVIAGFIGVLILVRPFSHAFEIGALVAVMAALLNAAVSIQLKQLTKIDDPYTVVFYTYLFWVGMSLWPALPEWQWPSGVTWLQIAALGLFGTGGQLLWTRTMQLGEVSALSPISFLQLPLVTLFGWMWFAEQVDGYTLLGAAIILGANAYIAHREATLARQARSDKPSQSVTPVT